MNVSVIIPFYNAQETLGQCLEGLALQEVRPFEIILIDNGSTDQSLAVIRKAQQETGLPLVMASEVKRGPGPARNRGISLARGELVAFLDADCVAQPDWIRNIEAVFDQDPSLGAVGGIEDSVGRSLTTLMGAFLAVCWIGPSWEFRRVEITDKGDWLGDKYIPTFNSVYRKDLLSALGGFDESFFPAGEDIDLWMRALDQKARLVAWEPRLVVQHLQEITLRKLLQKSWEYINAAGHLARRHFSCRCIIQLTGTRALKCSLPRGTVILRRGFVKGWGLVAFLGLAAFLAPVFGVLVLVGILGFYFFRLNTRIRRKGYRGGLAANFVFLYIFLAREAVEFAASFWFSLKYRLIIY